MKCISLWQPWATLVVLGEKRIETRSWPTKHRGRMAIHAAKKWSWYQKHICTTEPFLSILNSRGYNPNNAMKELDFGAVIGSVELLDCQRIPVFHNYDLNKLFDQCISEKERAFGDFSWGRFAWQLDLPIHFDDPIPYRGRQGFFKIPDTKNDTGYVYKR